jgi:hypothetical protein
MLSLQSFRRKGVSLGYVGRNYNLKALQDLFMQDTVLWRALGAALRGKESQTCVHIFISCKVFKFGVFFDIFAELI